MLQKQFEALAAAIVAKGQQQYDYWALSHKRIDALTEMAAELRALKKAYGVIIDDCTDAQFSEALNIPQLQM